MSLYFDRSFLSFGKYSNNYINKELIIIENDRLHSRSYSQELRFLHKVFKSSFHMLISKGHKQGQTIIARIFYNLIPKISVFCSVEYQEMYLSFVFSIILKSFNYENHESYSHKKYRFFLLFIYFYLSSISPHLFN